MSAHKLVDPFSRDMQRHRLARRMTELGARTHTISRFTAQSRHQLAHLRKRWSINPQLRLRGPAPHSLTAMLHSSRLRTELACAAMMCRLLGLTYYQIASSRHVSCDPSLGERLCDAYELLVSCFPDAQMSLEHLLLLGRGLSRGVEIAMAHCARCRAAIIVDVLGPPKPLCSWCLKDPVRTSAHSQLSSRNSRTEGSKLSQRVKRSTLPLVRARCGLDTRS